MAPNSRLGSILKGHMRNPRRTECSLLHSDTLRFQLSRIMGKLGYAYVVIQASLNRFVSSALPPPSFEMMTSPLVGSGQVSNSSPPDPMIFSDMNTQSIAVNDTGNAGLQVRCNGQQFGTPLNLQSCAGTVAMINAYDKEVTFAMRYYHGSEHINCALPYRWLHRRFPGCDPHKP